MRILITSVVLFSFISTAFAVVPLPQSTRWLVYIDQQTPNPVWISRFNDEMAAGESEQMGQLIDRQSAESAPRPQYVRRASILTRKLRDLFGTRVSLVEIDMAKRKGVSELGLSIESGKSDDLAKFEEFRKSLAKNEVRNQSGEPVGGTSRRAHGVDSTRSGWFDSAGGGHRIHREIAETGFADL